MKYSQATHHGPKWESDHVLFRLWAPTAENIALILDDTLPEPMWHVGDGWYHLKSHKAKHGSKYNFLINNDMKVPDPASRFQDNDVNSASILFDPNEYEWPADQWQGRAWQEAVVYELHVGTFTEAGTFKGVQEKLDYLKSLGVTAIELMPIADFPGTRGWGYDGVLPYAPEASYGTPEDLKNLVNACHARGLMIILDVVYNHFGPSGNYLHVYAKSFFNENRKTLWGAAINFDNTTNRPVRDFFIDNALYWLNEYRFGGLRFDAVHAIQDESEKHFLNELADSIRASQPKERHVHLALENDKNQSHYLERGEDARPLHFNAQWNDDFHHVAHVFATKEDKSYYAHYVDNVVNRFGRSLAEGFVYQGEAMEDGTMRGEKSAHLPPDAFISFLQNHDQIGNRALGERLSHLIDNDLINLMSPLHLLCPQIPLLFMGEEWGVETPFLYFCDFEDELATAVREGRRKEFGSLDEFATEELQKQIPDPNDEKTFLASKLNWQQSEIEPCKTRLDITQKLLAVRRQHIVPLLKSGWIAGTYKIESDNLLQCSWQFKNGTLNLNANFSSAEWALPETQGAGENIWGDITKPLPPMSCASPIKRN